eukprot:2588136-Pyramimonas_sp.AAC.1
MPLPQPSAPRGDSSAAVSMAQCGRSDRSWAAPACTKGSGGSRCASRARQTGSKGPQCQPQAEAAASGQAGENVHLQNRPYDKGRSRGLRPAVPRAASGAYGAEAVSGCDPQPN